MILYPGNLYGHNLFRGEFGKYNKIWQNYFTHGMEVPAIPLIGIYSKVHYHEVQTTYVQGSLLQHYLK